MKDEKKLAILPYNKNCSQITRNCPPLYTDKPCTDGPQCYQNEAFSFCGIFRHCV